LFNRLTGAGVTADARMFATLDPTVRHITLPSKRRVLLSDTVGFIRKLPTALVKAFRATLEEVTEAALLLHVVDVSSPHATQYVAQVAHVLDEIGSAATPSILVLNKIDLAPETAGDAESLARRMIAEGHLPEQTSALPVSAKTGEGAAELLRAIDAGIDVDPTETVRLRIPLSDGAALSLLHERARVLKRRFREQYCDVEAEAPASVRRMLAPYVRSGR